MKTNEQIIEAAVNKAAAAGKVARLAFNARAERRGEELRAGYGREEKPVGCNLRGTTMSDRSFAEQCGE